ILRSDDLVELVDEGTIFGTSRLVAPVVARTPGLARCLGVAHLAVVGHVGSRGVGRFRSAVGHLFGRGFRLLDAHALHLFGIAGFALFSGLLLAPLLFAVVFLVVVGIARAVLAHLQRFEQIVHGVAELPLILEHILEPVEIAAGAILDERTPQI